MKKTWILTFCIISFFLAESCRKDVFTDDPKAMLTFSRDTVQFDTVFTTVGSATRNFKVKNTNKNAVKISRIRLGNGALSQFRVNVDGQPVTEIKDKELAGGDSMYVFVEVTIDPNNTATPFIVTDSIVFETNGNIQDVKLVAFGQNAHFYTQGKYLDCNTTWRNDLPYVIYNGVGVAPGCTLTIEKGVKIYSYRRSFFLVEGTLIVNGTTDEPVIFRGTRQEALYKNFPGQWYGIRIMPKSKNNRISNAIIENADFGLYTGLSGENDSALFEQDTASIRIEKTIIRNMAGYGIAGIKANIYGENLLVYNCGEFVILGGLGGKYVYRHCTFSNGLDAQFGLVRKTPSLAFVKSSLKNPQGAMYNFDINVEISNSIIWGSEEDEIEINGSFTAGNSDTTFRNNLIRAKKMKFGATNLLNQDPKFAGAYKKDYHLLPASPAKDFGILLNPPINKDLDDKNRLDKPDAGCYELQ